MTKCSLDELRKSFKDPVPVGMSISEFMEMKLSGTGWNIEELKNEIQRITLVIKSRHSLPKKEEPESFLKIAQYMRKRLSEDEYLEWVRNRHAQ